MHVFTDYPELTGENYPLHIAKKIAYQNNLKYNQLITMKKKHFYLLHFCTLLLLLQINIGYSAVPLISSGDCYNLALKNNGSLWGWGCNSNPAVQFDGTWTAASMGAEHFLAIKSDGSLWAWGDNDYGQLGIGYSSIIQQSPLRIGENNDWTAVSAKGCWSMAIKSDGSLWTWGCTDFYELPEGEIVEVGSAIPVQTNSTGTWTAIAAGYYQSLGLKNDGSLWRLNYDEQIGSAMLLDSTGTWTAVMGGGSQSLALKNDGSLWTWRQYSSSMVQLNVTGPWTAVSIGSSIWSNHVLGIKSDGSLWAWGENEYGQLGDGSTIESSTPILIDSTSTWTAIAAGEFHSVAVKSDGSFWTWGYNGSGQLGIGVETTRKLSSVQIEKDNNWLAVVAGDNYSLALKNDGSLWSWGNNDDGQLGIGDDSINIKQSPVRIGEDNDWTSISAGILYDNGHNLALKSDGSLWSWGYNFHGQLGNGLGGSIWRYNEYAPIRIGEDNDWSAFAAGGAHSLALKSDGTLWAWGTNGSGQLGIGDELITESFSPIQIGEDNDWSAIAAGGYHNLALKNDRSLWAWGNNNEGQLGDGSKEDKFSPARIGEDNDWIEIAGSPTHSLALKSDGSLWVWGKTLYADGSSSGSCVPSGPTPVQVGSDNDWIEIAAGGYGGPGIPGRGYNLALKSDGSLWTWGGNSYYGRLGTGDTFWSCSPSQIENSSQWSAVTAGVYHSLAIKSDGTLWAWGANDYGQIGDGTLWSEIPLRISAFINKKTGLSPGIYLLLGLL